MCIGPYSRFCINFNNRPSGIEPRTCPVFPCFPIRNVFSNEDKIQVEKNRQGLSNGR